MLLILTIATPVSAAASAPAVGHFTATVDFSTLTATPQGIHCFLEVQGVLEFSGSLEGIATGTTRALVFAACPNVLANPPGTFRDVFTSDLVFIGTLNDVPATATIAYQGKTAVGGAIDAKMRLSNRLHGVLDVDAVVAVGGSYIGFLQPD